VDEREQQAERPHELHDFGETPQVVFLLHGFPGLRSSVQRKILRDMSMRPSGAGYGRELSVRSDRRSSIGSRIKNSRYRSLCRERDSMEVIFLF